MKPYEIIASEITHRGEIVDVKSDTVVLPNGKKTRREIVLRVNASAVLPVDESGCVYLVRQYRHALEQMTLEIPAGVMDAGETDPRACAIRELKEETGFTAEKVEFMMKMHGAIGFCNEALFIYFAEGLVQGETHFDEEEFITVEKYFLDDAISLIASGEITDGKTMAALYAYKCR